MSHFIHYRPSMFRQPVDLEEMLAYCQPRSTILLRARRDLSYQRAKRALVIDRGWSGASKREISIHVKPDGATNPQLLKSADIWRVLIPTRVEF